MNRKVRKIIKTILWVIGFLTFTFCLGTIHNIDQTAWLLAIGASAGCLLFTISYWL